MAGFHFFVSGTGARACMGFALDLLHWQKTFNDELNQDFKVRIGMNTGEVVAGRSMASARAPYASTHNGANVMLSSYEGVLGSQSVAFDIWGDSVNTASRVEGDYSISRGSVVTLVDLLYRSGGEQWNCSYEQNACPS